MITKTHYLALQDEDVFEDCHDWETEIYFPPEVWFKIQRFVGRDFEKKRRGVIADCITELNHRNDLTLGGPMGYTIVGKRWGYSHGWVYERQHAYTDGSIEKDTASRVWNVKKSFGEKPWSLLAPCIDFRFMTKKELMYEAKKNGITKKTWKTKKLLIQALIKL